MTMSLSGFCKEHNLAKTTVKRWLNDKGFNTSNGLSDEAVEAATNQFIKVDAAIIPVEVDIERLDLDVSETAIYTEEDVDQFLALLDSAVDAVVVKEEQDRNSFINTRDRSNLIQGKIQEYKVKRFRQQIKSEIYGDLKIEEERQISKNLEEIKRLGKG